VYRQSDTTKEHSLYFLSGRLPIHHNSNRSLALVLTFIVGGGGETLAARPNITLEISEAIELIFNKIAIELQGNIRGFMGTKFTKNSNYYRSILAGIAVLFLF
jgi:hypothetical protein